MKIPNKKEITYYFTHFFWLSLLFVASYGYTNHFASQRTDHFELYMDIEKRIPFLPGWILVYFSINGFFVLPLFYLNKGEMRLLSQCFVWITIFASICFLVFPMRLGYTKPGSITTFPLIYKLFYTIEKPHNLFPSLHIAYSSLILRFVIKKTNHTEKLIFLFWFIFLVFSVLFTHQHHISDIFGGMMLTYLVLKITMYWQGKRRGLIGRDRS
ncbi:hypothetical protein EHR01_04020 [Leptospira mtsangambouensis]|uniref:Phosphatidic acid phosphatase type 2/haloperoxidase domain-containing protein n=1 Tax=Leptospira mtsangambouensis TaxID=2484912 RepID=A0ABY2P3I8_9LEPT|nr:phosphatase PAP2 family protein [Leptospira mtsangambouensis]TGM81962.1 hypothetical protein EHR01_04020 [Leptospira mtsangambouensis]